jgi:hypothetical protein
MQPIWKIPFALKDVEQVHPWPCLARYAAVRFLRRA